MASQFQHPEPRQPPTLEYGHRSPLKERVASLVLRPRGNRVASAAVGHFYRQLAVQLDAGIDIRRAVTTLAQQQAGSKLGNVLADARLRLETGDAFAEALAEHESVFGKADVRALAAGERAGVLEEALNRLASAREASARLKKSATTALAYPAVVVSFAIVLTLLLFAFVVPTIIGPIVKEGATLPLPTRIVAGASYLITRLWWLLAIVAVGGFFAGRHLLRTEVGRRGFDSVVLQVPVIGVMLHKHALAQAATLIGTCVRCGLNLVESIDLAASAARNTIVADALRRWQSGVEAGDEPAAAFSRAGRVPIPMADMIEVGVATGQLDATLAKVAERFESDVDETAKRLGALVEPAIVLVLGGLVLLIALAVLLPILQLGDVFGG